MKTINLIAWCLAIPFLLANSFLNATGQTINHGMHAVVTYRGYDSTAPVADIRKIGDPQGAGASPGANWAVQTPVANWDWAHMGHIFGIAIDQAGNVYFSATAMYNPGTNLGAATTPPAGSNFGPAGAGGIYKALAGSLSTVSTLISTGSGANQIPNGGYGLGNLAYNYPPANCLYASNPEDGKIYQIDQVTGTITSSFDPFTNNDGGPNVAPYGERVTGVAVNMEYDGTRRLYYSLVVSASQSEIWSVELGATGNMLAATNSLEIVLPPRLPGSLGYISDMAFSVRGDLLVAERGGPHESRIMQFFGKHNAWSLPMFLESGNYSVNSNSAGGVDYGEYDGNDPATCDSLVWFTANAIVTGSTWYYGLQSAPGSGYINHAGGSWLNEAYIVDLNSSANDKNGFGDVEFYDADSCDKGATDICSEISASLQGSPIDPCCYNLKISNQYHDQYFSGILVETNHLNINNVAAGSTWGNIDYQSPTSVLFSDSLHTTIPKDIFQLARLCFSGTGNDQLIVKWIGNGPQFDTVCIDTLEITSCGTPIDTNCAAVLNQTINCESGIITMSFQVKNNSSFTMRGITLYPTSTDITPVNSFIPIADLAPGQTSAIYSVQLNIQNNATNACFYFAACDINVPPGTSGQYPGFCCMDSIVYCTTIPQCNPCDAINISALGDAGGKCCYKLSLQNNFTDGTIHCIRFNGEAGAQFALFSGWSIMPPVSSNSVTICAPGGSIANGSFPDFADFCLTGTSVSPHHITVSFLDENGEVVCTKELTFECTLVAPTCANIVDDSLYCDGHMTKYSFHIKNNSPFPIYQVELRRSDTSIKLSNDVIITNPPIPTGGTGGPYLVSIDSGFEAGKDLCVYLSAHNNIYNPDSGIAATQCCTDSLGVICLPFIECGGTTACCDFADLVIPTGLTPNNDAINETYDIQNAFLCDHIKIVVYNRWGNIVFSDDHYANNWKGTNNKGETLPQGTYFVVIELATGSKKGTYVDIRY